MAVRQYPASSALSVSSLFPFKRLQKGKHAAVEEITD